MEIDRGDRWARVFNLFQRASLNDVHHQSAPSHTPRTDHDAGADDRRFSGG